MMILPNGGGGWRLAAGVSAALMRGISARLDSPGSRCRQGLTLVPISAQLELFCPPCNPT